MDEIEAANAIHDLMADIGHAVWALQEVETTLATYLVLRLHGSFGMGEVKAEELLRKATDRTMGSVLREFTRSGVLESGLGERLATLAEERNWLVHRARRENRRLLVDVQERRQLSNHCERISDEALALLHDVAEAIERHVVAAGVSKEWIDKESLTRARDLGLL